MVILSNYDQWSGEVEHVLRPAMGEAYVLELHIPGDEGAGTSISFGGRSIDYVVPEHGAVTDWTTIREVTP
jgi:hypothetical protein